MKDEVSMRFSGSSRSGQAPKWTLSMCNASTSGSGAKLVRLSQMADKISPLQVKATIGRR